MCLAQGPIHSDAGEALTAALWSRVKHTTTEPLRSLSKACVSEQSRQSLCCLFGQSMEIHNALDNIPKGKIGLDFKIMCVFLLPDECSYLKPLKRQSQQKLSAFRLLNV